MILVLVLSSFLLLSGYVISALQSATSARRFVEKVYLKQQSYHALVSVIPLIIQALREDDPSTDTLSDPWAFPFEVETERGRLRVTIYDEDRFLNLNQVDREGVYREVFERLLTLLEINPRYTDALLTWLGKGEGGLWTRYPPKRGDLDSPYELAYMGMEEEDLYGRTVGDITYPGILSLVTTYSSGRINLNTAPKYVLMALDPRIDATLADRILKFREGKPFRKVEDLVLVEGVTFDILYRIRKIVDVKSTHFRITATVETGDVETTVELIYSREDDRIVYKRIY